MKRLLAAGALLLLAAAPHATPSFMPVDEIRPGMVGTGHTVFAGSTREPFKAHIIGVLKNVLGPKRDIILARLDGGPIKDAGVIQGMSGSPVYIDGRLIGAVSYALGAFPKEAIAGITPIGEMIEDAALATPRSASGGLALEFPLTSEHVAAALRTAHARLFGAPMSEAAAAQGLRPIGVPLVVGGMDPRMTDFLRSALSTTGFVTVSAGTSTPNPRTPERPNDRPFEPGDAIGISIINGDLQIGATGTVTHVDGPHVYAFGHPFLNLGPIDFPMTRADVLTVLPSMATSIKIAALGEEVGAITQDRATTIAGRVGARAVMIPVTMTLTSERGLRRDLKFRIVHDPLLTPLYGYVAVLNALISYERQAGASTFVLKGSVAVEGQSPVTFDDVVSGDSALPAGAASVAGPLAALLATDRGTARVTGISLEVDARETTSTASIERVWLDTVRPRPGDTVPLHVQVRHFRGATETITIPIEVPAHARGRMTLLISDGDALAAWERRDGRAETPATVADLVRVLNKTPRANRIYVRLVADAPGAVVNGEAMGSLPPSVQSIFTDNRAANSSALRQAVLGAWDRRLDVSVRGSRELTFTVDASR
ncbi:MAG TPA: SpoIVB peptidase S55 domain-containing protein [Vicinamibacterales bacterium]|nr:SpoIVB peptidase S55 domain-containing protein [Vicinamibacterales bacterium]